MKAKGVPNPGREGESERSLVRAQGLSSGRSVGSVKEAPLQREYTVFSWFNNISIVYRLNTPFSLELQ